MANIKDLKKYVGYEFSSGCYTGDDYKSFQTKYLNYLRSICKQNHWQLVNVGKNHYCFSAFIKSAENKCVYISISDSDIFPTNGITTYLSARQKTKLIIAAGSTTIQRLKIWKEWLPIYSKIYRSKEIRK